MGRICADCVDGRHGETGNESFEGAKGLNRYSFGWWRRWCWVRLVTDVGTEGFFRQEDEYVHNRGYCGEVDYWRLMLVVDASELHIQARAFVVKLGSGR